MKHFLLKWGCLFRFFGFVAILVAAVFVVMSGLFPTPTNNIDQQSIRELPHNLEAPNAALPSELEQALANISDDSPSDAELQQILQNVE